MCSASMNKNYHYPTLDQLLYCTAAHSQLPGRLWVRYGDSSAPIHENLALNNYLPFKVYYNYSHHLELKVDAIHFTQIAYATVTHNVMHLGMLFSIMLELLPISIVFVIIILAA